MKRKKWGFGTNELWNNANKLLEIKSSEFLSNFQLCCASSFAFIKNDALIAMVVLFGVHTHSTLTLHLYWFCIFNFCTFSRKVSANIVFKTLQAIWMQFITSFDTYLNALQMCILHRIRNSLGTHSIRHRIFMREMFICVRLPPQAKAELFYDLSSLLTVQNPYTYSAFFIP